MESKPNLSIKPVGNPFEVNPLLLKRKIAIEAFEGSEPYNSQIAGDFHFFMHGLRSLIDIYGTLEDNDKSIAKQFITEGIDLMESKSPDFAVYAEKNISRDPLMKPKSVEEDYFFLYASAVSAGIIDDKADIQKHLEEARKNSAYMWASSKLVEALKEKMN